MATGQLTHVLRHLHRVTLAQDAGVTDGQLLEGFLSRRDEAAFEALLHRHGPMVLGVCRRVLLNAHDAEDAFQATFLVLVRKAASVVPRETVGNWLYGVAYRTALKAREMIGKRRAKERNMAKPEAVEGPTWDELRPLLDRELNLLPDKYRLPVVLCDLEGKKRKDVAHQLGWPEGTLSCRLARARALLAKRLARHGLTFSSASLGVAMAAAASAGVPESLAVGTIKAAMRTAAGQVAEAGLIPARVAALTEGVLQVMSLSKMKTTIFVVLAVGAMLTAGGVLAQRPTAAGQSPPSSNQGSLRDTILVLDQQVWEAGSKHDIDTLNRLFAGDFVGLGHEGTRWTKPALLDQYRRVRTGDLRVTKAKEVFRLNPHTAVLTYEAKFKVYNRDGTLHDAAHQQMTSCWVQRDGGWFVKFSQVSKVAAPTTQVNFNLNPYLSSTLTPYGNSNLMNPYLLPNLLPNGNINFNPYLTPYGNTLGFNPYLTPYGNSNSPQMIYKIPQSPSLIGMPVPNSQPPAPKAGKPVVTARQAEKGSAEIRGFSWLKTSEATMPFRVRLSQPVQVGAYVPGKEESSFPDLKEGIHLSGGPLNRVTELTVDGTLQKVHNQFGRTTLDLAVPTNGAKELSVDGFLLANKLRVQIDGNPASLKDLKAGMRVSMQMVKKTDTIVAVEIRAGKNMDSLQPKEGEATRSSAAHEMLPELGWWVHLFAKR